MAGLSVAYGARRRADLSQSEVEREVLGKYFARQFLILTSRHTPEDVILVRVLADHHGFAVRQARQGDLDAARSTLRSLRHMANFQDEELIAAFDVFASPALALVDWYAGDHGSAMRLLEHGLSACLTLVDRYGHDYLSARRIHLAANTARLLASGPAVDRASARARALKRVVAGQRGDWPFEGAASLEVPLEGVERAVLDEQLSRILARIDRGEGGGR